MTPLTQQLEDKKKGCGIIVNVDNSDKGFGGWQCGQYYDSFKRIYYCKRCSKIIAILEQAIAEIKNIQSQQNKIKSNSNSQDLDFIFFTEQKKTGSADISNLLQKQRQEILEKIDKLPKKDITPRDDGNGLYTEVTDCEYGGFVKVEDLEILKKQLNQPKTEK